MSYKLQSNMMALHVAKRYDKEAHLKTGVFTVYFWVKNITNTNRVELQG